ncbi:MAG: hypothetical protein NVS3B21_23040 [Acidimicrobiales bacterium]
MAVGTQLAAIVVSDLVGSTQLRARIGEDAAEALRRDHDRLLTAAVLAAGGVVVKGMGDGVLARFNGAAEAVDAAVTIQQASVELSRIHGPVAMRVGIGAGDVTVEDGDVFGTPVIIASRLCGAAGDGGILVADLVRLLSHGRGGHVFVDVGPLELKGLPEAVVAARVMWESATATAPALAIPLQSMLTMTEGFPFAGRDAAVAMLADAWKRAVAERRQVILVRGEPGIGKTRLVTELARTVADKGGVVLMGRCSDDLRAPYGPFAEALGHLVAHAPDSLLADHVGAAGGDMVRLLPEISLRVPDVPAPVVGDPELERLRVYRSVADLLARAGDLSPVLLVLDDLHWADAATVGLLMWLVRDSRPMRVAIVVTYRDTDVDRTHPFGKALADLRRIPDVQRLPLGGLNVDELAVWLERAGDQPIDDDTRRLAGILESETEGNPFFVGEVISHLVESGIIHHEDGRWVADASLVEASVPEGVRDVVGRRMSALGDDVNDVLQAASLLGAEFDLAILAQLVGKPTEMLVELLVEPCQGRLIIESDHVDRYVFAHSLIRQTLAEELPSGRRARLHKAAADAIEEATPDAHADIARHLAAAGPVGDPTRAMTHACLAAEAASDQRAWEDAADWYETAIDLEALIAPDDPVRRARLLIALGQTKNAMGQERRARDDFLAAANLARTTGDAVLFADAVCAYGGMAGVMVDLADVRGKALLDEALALLPTAPTPTRIALLSQRAMWEVMAVDRSDAYRYIDEAVAAARVSGDEAVLLLALRAASVFVAGTVPDASQYALVDEYEELARRMGIDTDLATALTFRTFVQMQAGAFQDVTATVLEAERHSLRAGVASRLLFSGATLNEFRISNGLFDEALAILDTLCRDGRTVVEDLIDVAQRNWIAEVADDRSTYGESVAVCETAHSGYWRIPLWRLRITSWSDPYKAQIIVRRWAAEERPKVPAIYATAADGLACSILADVPEPVAAAQCYEALLAWAELWPCSAATRLCGVGHHLLGLAARAMGRLDDSANHLRCGLELHEASELPLFIAESHIELARTLVARDGPGDWDAARPHIDQAGSIAGERGFRRVERLVREVRAVI